jgi:endonuclease/exonuclease/phosphatase family metal-dependent hydrolase
MRYLPAGKEAMPLAVASYHLNYASAANRVAEAEWLSTWADKKGTSRNGETVRMPCLLAGDANSYPVPGTGHAVEPRPSDRQTPLPQLPLPY